MIGFSVGFALDPVARGAHPVMASSPVDQGRPMTHQQQPPVMHGYSASPPNNDWAPQPSPPAKSRATPWLVAAIAVLAAAAAGLGFLLLDDRGEEPATPAAPALTQAGAERACRTAFGSEWESRAHGVSGDIVKSVQEIEMLETVPNASGGYTVNGTIHFTLTSGILDPVQDTLDLTCNVFGTDARPNAVVSNRS